MNCRNVSQGYTCMTASSCCQESADSRVYPSMCESLFRRERNVYDNDFLSRLEKCLQGGVGNASAPGSGVPSDPRSDRGSSSVEVAGGAAGTVLTGSAAIVAPLLMQMDEMEKRSQMMVRKVCVQSRVRACVGLQKSVPFPKCVPVSVSVCVCVCVRACRRRK
jgi:hypothetical protein